MCGELPGKSYAATFVPCPTGWPLRRLNWTAEKASSQGGIICKISLSKSYIPSKYNSDNLLLDGTVCGTCAVAPGDSFCVGTTTTYTGHYFAVS